MSQKAIHDIKKLGNVWEASDPFLFSVHHRDAYPQGNDEMGPVAALEGRQIGNDFQGINGWNMYHGDTVPGFPGHPHRGFETVTVVLEGYIDHFDSVGSTGRFGVGDVQWMTAGKGCIHSEMFPLLNKDQDNPLELFQIWLNLPSKDKFADPHYKMLWAEDIPVIVNENASGKKSSVRLISGTYQGTKSLEPSPNSWASDASHHVGIWLIHLEPGAEVELPQVSATLNRTVYFYEGDTITIGETMIHNSHSVKLSGGEAQVIIKNGSAESNLLLLEGEPIGEPVVSHGPFVMNSEMEIKAAFHEYRMTNFGGWPWDRMDPVHPREQCRFARYADGTVEHRDK